MKRFSFVIVLGLTLASPARASPDAAEAAAILQLVLADEAAGQVGNPFGRACVVPETSRTAFDSTREERLMLERDFRSFGRGASWGQRLKELGSGEHQWTQATHDQPGRWTNGRPLPPADAQILSSAAGEIIRGETPLHLVDKIDAGWLRMPLTLCGNGRHPLTVTFTSPAIRGDTAFVESSFLCGSLCGAGLLYALRRSGSGWAVVSIVSTWIS